MPKAYVVTPEILSRFKEPFGLLIQGPPSETIKQLKKIIDKERISNIISVGDTVSINLHKHNIIPQLSIIDNQTMRKKIVPQTFPDKKVVHVDNPQGKITQKAIDAIRDAFQSKKNIQIVVDGEEDLLTLIVTMHAPENALIVYGQPRKGMVVVKVTPEKQLEARGLWRRIENVKENR